MNLKFTIIFFLLLSGYLSPQERKMSVTMDDLPLVRPLEDSLYYFYTTNEILHHFKTFDIPAVGFVIEGRLYNEGIPESYRVSTLELWIKNGYELGNHTYSHFSLNEIPLQQYINDLEKGSVITRNISEKYGLPYRFFRHPYLHTGRSLPVKDSLSNYLKDNNYTIAPVTIDNSEWIFALAYDKALNSDDTITMKMVISEYITYMIEKIRYFEKISEALFGYNINHILLLHANQLNAAAGGLLFTAIKEMGYKFISLEDALEDPAYKSKDTFTGRGGISWLHRWALTSGKAKEFFKGEPLVSEKILDIAGVESE